MLAAWTGEQWQMGRVALKANLWLYLLQGTCFSPSHWGLTPAMLDQRDAMSRLSEVRGKNTLIFNYLFFSAI